VPELGLIGMLLPGRRAAQKRAVILAQFNPVSLNDSAIYRISTR
jgi:hypothetical protein